MMTGIEIPIITAVSTKIAAVIESNRTSVLIEEARKILNDERIMNLLSLLYELDPKLAAENNKRYARARAICNNLNLMKGSKYILIRYISARSAASLASEYQNSVADNTSDAKIKQARENGLLKREQMKHSSKKTKQANTHSLRLAPHSAQNHHIAIANNTPEYSLETPGGAAFAYPRGTPDNPTVSCSVGSKPILPNGLKFGTLAYYYQPSHVAMISSGQTEEDDLVPIIEITDLLNSSQRGSDQGFHRSLHRRRSTDSEELAAEVIRSELQDTAETVHCIGTFRIANRSNNDVASIASTYLSFDDPDTEGGRVSDESLLDDF